MKKVFYLEGVEYTVTSCTAKARPDNDQPIEQALHLRRSVDGTDSECVMYEAEMPYDDLTMTALIKYPGEICTDPNVLASVVLDEEPVMDVRDPDYLLGELNRITEQHRQEMDKAEAALDKERDARRQDALRYAEEKARDRFMNGQFLTVIMIAIVILLANFKAMTIWLAILVCLALFVRMVYATKVYYGKRKEKKRG